MLHKLHTIRAAEMWPWLAEGLKKAGYNQMEILGSLNMNMVDVFLATDPKCWFFVSWMHDIIDKDFKVMRIFAGWSRDKISGYLARELIHNLHELAKGGKVNAILFNRDCKFLDHLLIHAETEHDPYNHALEASWLKVQ